MDGADSTFWRDCGRLAAVVYVAHVGQAKADAGTGYELAAITAVVLGGTSIFGGQGSVLGTILGLFAIAVLQNGLRMAGYAASWPAFSTGVLLLTTMASISPGSPPRRRMRNRGHAAGGIRT